MSKPEITNPVRSQDVFTKPLLINSTQLERLFSCLQSHPGAMFLDSASKDHPNSNISIFVWQPNYTIETYDKTTFVYKENQLIEQTEQDPLAQIEKYLHTLKTIKSDFAFTGGAVGYWDYELGGHFEALPGAKPSDINLPNMYIGIYSSAIVVDHQHNTINFVSQDKAAEDQWESLNGVITSLINNTLELNPALAQTTRLNADTANQPASQPPSSIFELTSSWQSNMSKAEYSERFYQVQQHLLSGDSYQINLAQRFSASYCGDEWQAYNKLRTQNAAPFSSFIRHQHGAVLSVSPERFIQVNNGQIETKPIKGTRPRHASPERDRVLAEQLQQATKDRAENLMIVDLLRNDLSKVAVPGTVDVPELFAIESFPAVHHLVSKVTAVLDAQFTSLDLLRGAFPGGSITGAPKIRAMQIIHQLEPHPRSVYCGAIGYVKPGGDMDSNIAIRTLVCNQNKIHCWAGGGLVADSICDDEYQETLDKVNKILPILEA